MLFGLAGASYAQKKQILKDQDQMPVLISESKKKTDVDIRIPIMKAIKMDANELNMIGKNDLHIMSVGVSFNDKGAVDTVYLSKMLAPEIFKILKPDAYLTKKVREGLKDLRTYRTKVVVFPVLIFDVHGDQAAHSQIMLKEFAGIWPELRTDDKKKPLILLDPFPNGFSRTVR